MSSDESTVRARDEAPAKGRRVPAFAWTDRAGKHVVPILEAMVVGSASRSPITLADRTVSRLHAEIEPAEDSVWVRDLGSLNGTWVDGILVREARVPIGRAVKLGAIEVAVVAETGPEVEAWAGDELGPLFGASPAMHALFAQLARVAKSEAAVLIGGETGTGKELCARAIHEASARADGPFVVIDCAALPESLLESELFGHARGAFTGALAARGGAFEDASGGTVFLDEVAELPLPVQPKLLRVLESRTVRRIGESDHRPVDVRIVAATHRDLARMVTSGGFREDLFFRLAVLPVRVPPLRERASDIAPLLGRFLGRRAEDVLGAELLAQLARLPWLGNVRELRNFAARVQALGVDAAFALARAGGDTPMTSSLPPAPEAAAPGLEGSFKEFRERWIDRGEAEYVRALLERHGHRVTESAEAAGLNRSHLYRLIKKHAI